MRRADLLQRIAESRIIIFGTGEKGRRFCMKYKDKLHMAYATSNLDNETVGNLERIEWSNFAGREEYLIIVCSGAENEIAYQLFERGLEYGKDFINQDIAEALLDGKEIVLSVGQCELEVTNYIFNSIPEFAEKYMGICYREYDVLGLKELKTPKLEISLMANQVTELADYFIYPANLSKERQDYYQMLLERIPSGCRSVSVPLTTFEGYWPQDSAPYYETSPYYKKNENDLYPFGGRRDINLENAVENGTVEKEIKKILRDDFYSKEEVYKLFQKTLKKYRVLERKSDIKISDFLEENYLVRRVFLDRGHACDFVLKEYAKRILTFLDIAINLEMIEKINLDWYKQHHFEQPIYSSVQRCLKFKEQKEYCLFVNKILTCTDKKEYFAIQCRYMELIKRINLL